MSTVSKLICSTCNAVHGALGCPAPRSYGAAHFRGMGISAGLRGALAGKVQGLISLGRGSIDQIAEHLAMPEWKVRRLATGDVDPTLGEMGRIAGLAGGETLEAFMALLVDDARNPAQATEHGVVARSLRTISRGRV